MISEIWKDVPGYEGQYQVSDQGRARSLDRVIVRKDGHRKKLKGRELKASAGSNGYLSVALCVHGHPKYYNIHQLVASAFMSHRASRQWVIDHINNDPLDNRRSNLQIISQRKNTSKDRQGGSSAYVGVCWDKCAGRWSANICIGPKKKSLGTFVDEKRASEAYQEALRSIGA